MDHVYNVSSVTFFTLLSVNETLNYRVVIFSLTLLFYNVVLFVNVLLIMTIVLDRNLHEPMYILICVCCINGLFGMAGFYPKFLVDLLSSSQLISYTGCLCQGFAMFLFSCNDASILTVMAYDRYVAICWPLQYHSVMTRRKLSQLVCYSWLLPLLMSTINILLTSRLKLCGSNIQRLFCVNWFILTLACPDQDTLLNDVFAFITLTIFIGHSLFIFWSYVYIIKTCVRSKEDRAKFMQTCLPNFISLVTTFVIGVFDVMHRRFTLKHFPQNIQNFLALAYLIIPPVLNPLMYGFKMTKIRIRILILFNFRCLSTMIKDVRHSTMKVHI